MTPGKQGKPAHGGKPRQDALILVIDDNARARTAAMRMFEEAGYSAVGAAAAPEAIELARQRRPALVLLSAALHGGVEAARELKRDPGVGGAFVILVSASSQEDAEAVMAEAADGYMPRGLGRAELLARVEAFLRIRAGQEALRDSEERYKALFDRSLDCVYLTDLKGRFLDANQAGLDLLGLRREDLGSLTVRSLLTGDQIPLALRTTREIVRTGRQHERVEYRFRRKDGRLVFVESTGSLIFRNGKAFAIQGIARDITERKQAEQALRQSEERLQIMAEGNPTILWVTDSEGGNLFVNRKYREFFGVTSGQVKGSKWQPLLHPDDAAGYLEATARAIRARTALHAEARVRRADGEWRWIDSQGEPRFSACGDFLGHVGVSVDITERKRAEAALRESEARHRTVIAAAMDGFWRVGQKGRLLEVNETYCRMSGYSAEELLSMRISDLEAVETEADVASHAQDILSSGQDRFESRHRRKDGSVFDVEVSAQYRPAEGGSYVVFLRDITCRKRAEQERARLQEQLAQAQKMESVGRLAGGVAHDFNNLLTVINGYAAFLSQELAVRDPLRDYAVQISEAGKRAASLTSQLLAFGRKQAIMPRAIDLNEVVANTERMLQRLIGEDIHLVAKPAPRLGRVMADPDQIHQIIMNLAVNARDAMPGGGRLEITTTEVEVDETAAARNPDAAPGRYVQLTVSDTGIGMTEDVRKNIFEPFFTTKERGKGTGLGLSMVYGVVRQNGGWIEVKSEPGRGSAFQVYLPRIEGAAEESHEKPAEPKALRGSETVLVVEDQEMVRELTKTILQAHGYRVLEAASGEEAQAVARLHPSDIDLLLTDIVMPGMDGRTLAQQLRDLRPKLRAILMSGYAEDVADRGEMARGLAYIQKPFTSQELAAKVREILAA